MPIEVPNILLNNGKKMPIIGLGTWKSKPGEVTHAVKDAIDANYRHLDCACIYQNEVEVGAGIKSKLADGTIVREDLFITSKLWNTFHGKELVVPAIKKTLENLGVSYIDLYLIHWPMGYKEGGGLLPRDADGKWQFSSVDYVDTWKGMEECIALGLTKSIGLSNFNSKQIERILAVATTVPVINQIECHPYLNQKKLIDFCKNKNMAVTAYSPLGSPDRPWAKPEDPQLMDDPKVKKIAKKYNKSAAQVLIRYQIEHGVIVIPKSVTKSRIQENFDVFDFQLTPEDVAEIDTFDTNGRFCPVEWLRDHPHYPFLIEF